MLSLSTGAFMMIDHLRSRGLECKDLLGVVKYKGGMSGGTATTAVTTFEKYIEVATTVTNGAQNAAQYTARSSTSVFVEPS